MMINVVGLVTRPLQFPLGAIVAAPMLISIAVLPVLGALPGLLATVGAIALLISGAWLFLMLSLPEVSGRRGLKGLRDDAEIARDADGIPHIRARCSEDAYRALGFAHAQDRLWQIEYQRRVAAGEVAEIVGRRGIALDRFMRTIGLRQAAFATWQELAPDLRDVLEAYADGVNQALDAMRTWRLPPEFQLLALSPRPFTGLDVVLTTKLWAWDLAGTYVTHLLWHDLSRLLGETRATQLFPAWARDATCARAKDAPPSSIGAADSIVRPYGESVGSNSWVIGGERSVNGVPVLANDPHLPATMPISWYVAHLRADDLDVVGATIPGIPFVLIGRNRDIAWGAVNINADVQDLFLENLDQEGTAVRFCGRWEPLQQRQESLQVCGGTPQRMTVRSSRHGPLLSDVLNTKGRNGAEWPPLALAWSGLGASDTSLATFRMLATARNRADFQAALALLVAPALHFTYADRAGCIGRVVAGRIPRRVSPARPALRDGSSGDDEWKGWLAPEELPRFFGQSPPIVVVNTPTALDAQVIDLGHQWLAPYRRQRIVERLNAQPRLSVGDHESIQADPFSGHARAALPLLLERTRPLVTSPHARLGLRVLSEWDCQAGVTSSPAALFAAWWRRLPAALLSTELDAKALAAYLPWASFVDRFVQDEIARLPPMQAGGLLVRALEEAMIELERRLGPDPSRWQWGELHRVVFAHQPFHNTRLLGALFSRSAKVGGDWSSVNVSPSLSGSAYVQTLVAGYRQIIDMSDLDAGRFCLATGQAGHFLSRHYSNQMGDWLAGRTRSLRMSGSGQRPESILHLSARLEARA
jgi:penicillin amidase